jgi:hypothetical protein
MQAVTKKAGVKMLTVHSLRHSFASIHLMNGTPVQEVSALLGLHNVIPYRNFIPKTRTDPSRFSAAIFSEKDKEK